MAHRYELRRHKDGFVVDGAHEVWILARAGLVSMGQVGSSKGLVHVVIHTPTGTEVGGWRQRRSGTHDWGWWFDHQLIARLEGRDGCR